MSGSFALFGCVHSMFAMQVVSMVSHRRADGRSGLC